MIKKKKLARLVALIAILVLSPPLCGTSFSDSGAGFSPPADTAPSAMLYGVTSSISLSVNVSPAAYQPGSSGVISISAKNSSLGDIPNVTLALDMPLFFTPGYSSLSVGSSGNQLIIGSQNGSVYSFKVGTIPAGKYAILSVNFMVNDLTPAGLYSCEAGAVYGNPSLISEASGNIIVMPASSTPGDPEKKYPTEAPDKFIDDAGHWAEMFINILADEGVVNGTGEGIFEPETSLTRAMIAQLLYNVYGGGELIAYNSFTDLSQDWYVNAVNWAAKNELVYGVTDNEFMPDSLATREQAVTILGRLTSFLNRILPSEVSRQEFADSGSITDYAAEAVYAFQQAGIISGDEDGNFNPSGAIKRAEFSKILCLYMDIFDELGYDISGLK